jgi:hypothetical protein
MKVLWDLPSNSRASTAWMELELSEAQAEQLLGSTEKGHVCHEGYVGLLPLFLRLLRRDDPRLRVLITKLLDEETLWSSVGIRYGVGLSCGRIFKFGCLALAPFTQLHCSSTDSSTALPSHCPVLCFLAPLFLVGTADPCPRRTLSTASRMIIGVGKCG